MGRKTARSGDFLALAARNLNALLPPVLLFDEATGALVYANKAARSRVDRRIRLGELSAPPGEQAQACQLRQMPCHACRAAEGLAAVLLDLPYLSAPSCRVLVQTLAYVLAHIWLPASRGETCAVPADVVQKRTALLIEWMYTDGMPALILGENTDQLHMPEKVPGQVYPWHELVTPHSSARLMAHVQELLERRTDRLQIDCVMRTTDGLRNQWAVGFPVFDEMGAPFGLIGFQYDLNEGPEKVEQSAVLDLAHLRTLQRLFTQVTGLRSEVYDHTGQVIRPEEDGDELGELLTSTPGGVALVRELCGGIVRAAQNAPDDRSQSYGWVLLTPLRVEDGFVGVWVSYAGTNDPEELAKIRLSLAQSGVDEEAFFRLYRQLPVLSVREAQRAMQLQEGFARLTCLHGQQGLYRARETALARQSSDMLRMNYEDQVFTNHVLDLFFTSADIRRATQEILLLAVRYLGVERAYVAEYLSDGALMITYEAHISGAPLPVPFAVDEAALKARALFQAPLQVDERVHGIIGLEDSRSQRQSVPREQALVRNVARVMSGVLQRTVAQDELRRSLSMFRVVTDNLDSLLFVRDPHTDELLFYNQRMSDELQGSPPTAKACLMAIGGPQAEEAMLLSGAWEVHNPQSGRWFTLSASALRWVDGRDARLYRAADITEKKMQQVRLDELVYQDVMLSIPNRASCERRLATAMGDAVERQGFGALLFVDLDDFKNINDAYGHNYGDLMLKEVVGYLTSLAPLHGNLYRFGGDEFVIVLENTAADVAEEIGRAIVHRFQQPWKLQDREHFCTVSISLAEFPRDGDTVRDILRAVNVAMFRAKSDGKNTLAVYAHQQGDEVARRVELERRMRSAIQDDFRPFHLCYMPLVDLSTGKWKGAEALIRWRDPDLGLIMPADFVPLAEYLGLIRPIGAFVLRTACAQGRAWQMAGWKDFYVSVNLSPRQIRDDDLVALVKNVLQETSFPAHSLILEVTESLAISDMASTVRVLRQLRAMGVQIAMDDFGTGYSSLNNLRSIPLDYVKVDRSFLQDIDRDPFSRMFVHAIIDLAHSMDIKACVEGVETPAQASLVRELYCDLAQGYLYTRPVEATQFALLAASAL